MTRHSIAIETAEQRWVYPNTPLGRLLAPPLTPYMVDRTNMPMRRIRP